MTAASTLSLLALFLVDLVDMFFLSLLGEVELAAAVGYAGSVLFFTTSICLGLAIATGALAARALGAEQPWRARRYFINACVFILLLTLPVAALLWLAVPQVLSWLGATGRALELATSYLRILIPTMPVLALAMASNSMLRAIGDARRSMLAMLAGSLVNAVLDPIFIFVLNLGVDGAALASACARFTILGLSYYYTIRVHNLLIRFDLTAFKPDVKPIAKLAFPAILTNIATPIGNAYVTASIAVFGDSAVAGIAIISRVAPVAFCAIFALSGALGPVIGQNYGAARFDRVRQALLDSLKLIAAYVASVWIILNLLQEPIIRLFGVDNEAAELIRLFCDFITLSFIFNGLTFATNAAFNNLARAHYATVFNLGKATLGTIPFVYYGALWLQAPGILIGQALGAAVFGIFGLFTTLALIEHLRQRSNLAL